MASIQPRTLCEIADAVAFESRRPWRIKELRAEAFEAWRTVVPRRDASMGLSREQAFARQHGHAYERVLKAGRDMDALPPDERKPTPERIDAALDAFTTDQWEILVKVFGQEQTYLLEKYIDSTDTDKSKARYERLKREIGAKKLHGILAAVVQRGLELWTRTDRPKVVAISDPVHADDRRKQVRQANREGRGHVAKGRPVAELGSDRSIARYLSKRDEQTDREMKVSPYHVKQWGERMEALPFEQFAADKTDDEVKSGAARIDYLLMIRKPYQRNL